MKKALTSSLIVCLILAGCTIKQSPERSTVAHNDTTVFAFAPGLQEDLTDSVIHLTHSLTNDSLSIRATAHRDEGAMIVQIKESPETLTRVYALENEIKRQQRIMYVLATVCLFLAGVSVFLFLIRYTSNSLKFAVFAVALLAGSNADAQTKKDKGPKIESVKIEYDFFITSPNGKDTVAYKIKGDSLAVVKDAQKLVNQYIIAATTEQNTRIVLIEILRCFNSIGELSDPEKLRAIIKKVNE